MVPLLSLSHCLTTYSQTLIPQCFTITYEYVMHLLANAVYGTQQYSAGQLATMFKLTLLLLFFFSKLINKQYIRASTSP